MNGTGVNHLSKAQQEAEDQRLIEAKMDELMTVGRQNGMTLDEVGEVIRAFKFADNLHRGVRRKSGEPYILHPIEVAIITVREFGLQLMMVQSALLHDVAEDTPCGVDQIKNIFGERVAHIVDGVTKVNYQKAEQSVEQSRRDNLDNAKRKAWERKKKALEEGATPADSTLDELTRTDSEPEESLQAATYSKILKMMCTDILIFYVKISDRLHNMRTLEALDEKRRLAICSETSYLYIPIANRLGLYYIKNELENLVMKHSNPKQYEEIRQRIDADSGMSERLRQEFTPEIKRILKEGGFEEGRDYRIRTRTKTPFSCWNKMQNKGVPFEDIYDLYAMRIILNVPEAVEKQRCQQVWQIIHDHYEEVEGRLRNWLDYPKANGYMSLHTTIHVPEPINRFVEVQIRSERMDKIAENGDASHVIYKIVHPEVKDENIDVVSEWFRETLAILNDETKTREQAVKEVVENTYNKQVIVFTPMGKEVKLPANATILDFAFSVHTYLGVHCLGAKAGGKVVSLEQPLRNGETVEIIVSKSPQIQPHWVKLAYVPRTREIIRQQLRKQHKRQGEPGKQMLVRYMKDLRVLGENEDELFNTKLGELKRELHYTSDTDLYIDVLTGAVNEMAVAQAFDKLTREGNELLLLNNFRNVFNGDGTATQLEAKNVKDSNSRTFLLDKEYEHYQPEPAPCCNPLPGDMVVGIVKEGKILIHRTNCLKAQEEMANHKDRIVRCRWHKGKEVALLTGVSFEAQDRPGLLTDITKVISGEMELNMKAITLESSRHKVRGVIMLYVPDVQCVGDLIQKLRETKGIKQIHRI